MIEHGGRLRRAAQQYGIALTDWLDLSTGINPHPYPVPPIPAETWQRLPEGDDGLEAAAAGYFGTAALLPVAGSQPAIQALPQVIPGVRVSVLAPSYAEHAHAWRHHNASSFAAEALDDVAASNDIVVVVQPNNPTGTLFPRERLLAAHRRLAARGGWLVVDEAFIDTTPEASLATLAGTDGLVVLRSIGKFFGLAGARVGFVLAPATVRAALAERLGPWTVSGPARHAARHALLDRAWQDDTRRRLDMAGARLARLLRDTGCGQPRGPALFKWIARSDAGVLHARLAQQGILTRLFEHPPAVRFGLPANEAEWARLETALSACAANTIATASST